MKNKLLLERKIIKEFMSGMMLDLKPINDMAGRPHHDVCSMCHCNPCICSSQMCQVCHCDPCECAHSQDHYDHHGESHHQLHPDEQGVVSPEELYSHFDLDDSGKVTTDEYVDHIEYHCDNPETLEHYRNNYNFHKPPCQDSYEKSCRTFEIEPECIQDGLMQLMHKTNSSCPESLCMAILDFLKGSK